MAKNRMFNVRWREPDIKRLDAAVKRASGGKSAHATRASRSTVLLEAFKAFDRKPRQKDEDHPAWDDFYFFWDRSPRRGSRSQAWKVWKRYHDEGTLPSRDVVLRCFNNAMGGQGGWKEKFGTPDEKYIPHFSTWLSGPPWAGWAGEEPEPEPEGPGPQWLAPEEGSYGGGDGQIAPEAASEALKKLAAGLPVQRLPPCEAAAQSLRAAAENMGDVGHVFLGSIENTMLHDLKAWAGTPAGAELRSRYLAMVRQASDLEPDTWDDLVAAARKDPDVREMAGRVFVQVLREVYGVPLPFTLEAT